MAHSKRLAGKSGHILLGKSPHTDGLCVNGAKVAICGAKVAICGAKIATCGAKVAICGAKLAICGAKIAVCGAKTAIGGAKVMPHKICRGHILWGMYKAMLF